MRLRILRVIGRSAGAIFLAATFVRGARSNQFMWYPHVPDEGQGLVVPFDAKNGVVYISESEASMLHYLLMAQVGSALVAIGVLVVRGGNPFK